MKYVCIICGTKWDGVLAPLFTDHNECCKLSNFVRLNSDTKKLIKEENGKD